MNATNRPVVVLVQPRSPGNVGMTARAMANFGARDLRLVTPCDHLADEARRLAVGAEDLLEQARVCPDLETALADCRWTAAVTRRTGKRRGAALDPGALAAFLQDRPAVPCALVFGREDAGLTSAEVARCSHTVTIDAPGPQGSLNLAQAVLVLLYELARPCGAAPSKSTGPELLQADLQPLFDQLRTVLERIAFLNPHRPEHVLTPLQRLLARGIADHHDLALLRGVFGRLEASINDWPGTRRGDEKRRESG